MSLQNDLNLLYDWSLTWQLSCNILKCKHLHLGPAHNFGSYYLNHTTIDTTATHKDLGILFDECLKFHDYTTEVTAKANKVLGMVKRSFEHLNSCKISKLFTTLVRPILEYTG